MAWYERFFKQSPISEEKPTPKQSETAWASDSFVGSKGPKFTSYNPDLLVARKGSAIYESMLRDDQVKSAFNLILNIITSKSYRFVKPDDSELQKEIENFFLYNIKTAMRGNWGQALRSILMSKAHGFSVSEKNYFTDQVDGKDRWLLNSIKYKPFSSFEFEQDVYGNIKSLIQYQDSGRKNLNPDKFIIHVNKPEFNPVYGESDLRAAYRPYWEKDIILKLWSIYLERMAGGALVVKPGQGAAAMSNGERVNLERTLTNLTQSPSIKLPQGWEADIITSNSTDAFERAIISKDKQIAKSLLVPNLLGFSEQGSTGSFAQAETQFEVFMNVVNSESEALADTLNEQLFRELAWWNFGVKEFPRIEFDKYTETQKKSIAASWFEAIKSNAVKSDSNDENTVRSLLGFDLKDLEEMDDEDQEPEDPAKESVEDAPTEEGEEIKASDTTDFTEIDTTTSYVNRYNFAEIEQTLDDIEDSFFDELGNVVDMAFDEVKNAISEIVDSQPSVPGEGEDTINKEETDIETDLIRLNNAITGSVKSEINQVIRKHLRVSYEEGRAVGQEAVEQAAEGIQLSETKQRIVMASKMSKRVAVKHCKKLEYTWTVLDFQEGLNLDTAEKYFAAKAFNITGDITDEMLEKARMALLEGIKNGLSTQEIVKELADMMPNLLGKFDEETGTVDKETRARIETIVRTNISDAFNQANLAVYNDPDLGDFVEAYQYASIIDSRTTDFCNSYNGKIFSKNDPIWSNITPPNHFNCRSTLVAVTAIDDWAPSERSRSANGQLVQPSKGFGTIGG